MKAMIVAAGLGSRLKPWTDTHPKALVPVAGCPMLEHVIRRLHEAGCTELVINIHHFGHQILEFLQAKKNFGITIHISDERASLLDTGGGILHARRFLEQTDEPFLVHNVDILSDVDLGMLYAAHLQSGAVATLLMSKRPTSRYLLIDQTQRLCGWVSKTTGQLKPEGFCPDPTLHSEYAFGGIHVLSPSIFGWMDRLDAAGKFPIMDFYLALCGQAPVYGYPVEGLRLLDIGKPEALAAAEKFLRQGNSCG